MSSLKVSKCVQLFFFGNISNFVFLFNGSVLPGASTGELTLRQFLCFLLISVEFPYGNGRLGGNSVKGMTHGGCISGIRAS